MKIDKKVWTKPFIFVENLVKIYKKYFVFDITVIHFFYKNSFYKNHEPRNSQTMNSTTKIYLHIYKCSFLIGTKKPYIL